MKLYREPKLESRYIKRPIDSIDNLWQLRDCLCYDADCGGSGMDCLNCLYFQSNILELSDALTKEGRMLKKTALEFQLDYLSNTKQ